MESMKHSRSVFELTRYAYKLRGGTIEGPLHSHPQFEVLYIDHANCDYMLGDRIVQLQPGDLFILNGLTVHCPSVRAGQPLNAFEEYARTVLVFEQQLVQMIQPEFHVPDLLLPFKKLKNFHLRLNEEHKKECETILSRINRFYGLDDPVSESRFFVAFFDLLLFIYDQCKSALDKLENVPRKEQYVRKVIDFLESKYMQHIQLEQIEAHMHMSKFHISKLFQEITGMSIFDYLQTWRINQAKALFHYSRENSVTSVCYQVGFKHVSHFSRAFKKIAGVSPGQYRKNLYGERINR